MPLEIISPRIRGFICLSAHPAGCAAHVAEQIEVARCRRSGTPTGGNALVIGSSTGYGLGSRVAAAFGHGMNTLGVFFEKPPSEKRTATAGWYNTAAFQSAAEAEGLKSLNINGDAFSNDVKQRTIEKLRQLGPVDLVVYSVAAPVRTHPDSGEAIRSTLKPIGEPFTGKTVNLDTGEVTEATIQPATDEEIAGTVAVMGGDDLRRWVEALLEAGVLARGARVVTYSYIGPQVTWPIYRSGTIGRAKEDMERTTDELDRRLQAAVGGSAWVSVNKAVVTQAAAAIPIVPLYISILYRVMKDMGLHERPIEQMVRMMNEHVGPGRTPALDAERRIRMDDWEMREDVQAEAERRWRAVTTESLPELGDFAGFRQEFRQLFGFEVPGVDYEAAVETDVLLEA
jgi:enoyl-[acyl-carrier protein] reductase / trans-2-enoyl-CoA reductase (NAD+)